MTRKLIPRVMLAAALTLALTASPVQAETYYNVDCSCDPKADGHEVSSRGKIYIGCVCMRSYTLGQVATKEFRFRCKSANSDPLPWVVIADRDGNTTCTAAGYDPSFFNYYSKSCTNWSYKYADTLTLEVMCTLK